MTHPSSFAEFNAVPATGPTYTELAREVEALKEANADALRLMRAEEARRVKAEAQVATLISGQQRNGEARQQAVLELAHELAEMEPPARDAAIRRIIDNHEDKP